MNGELANRVSTPQILCSAKKKLMALCGAKCDENQLL